MSETITISNGLRIKFTGSTGIDRYIVQRAINKENRRMKRMGSKRRVYVMNIKNSR